MSRLRICFEVLTGLATHDDGSPAPAGMQLDLGETEKEIDYAQLTANISIPGVLSHFGLDSMIRPEDVQVISPEEYDERYGS